MSDLHIVLAKLPNEILEEIFNYMEWSNLEVVSQVCQKWNAIVQRIHDRAWKSITKAVALKRSVSVCEYGDRGWIEEEHSMTDCLCVEIAKDLVFYGDVELLDSDVELLEKNQRGPRRIKLHELVDLEEPKLEEVQAASRLSAAGILTSLRYVFFLQIDLSSIKHLSYLVSNVYDILFLEDVTLNSLSEVFRHVKSRVFEISDHKPTLSDAEIKGLTNVLYSRVEKFLYRFGSEPIFPYIEHYDGRGKCREIEFEYLTNANEDEDEEQTDDDPDEKGFKDFILDLEKVKVWTECRGWLWSVDDMFYDHLKSKIINIKRN